jgi:LPXTG-motif cell wall-anchored protein
MNRSTYLALIALASAAATIWLLPAASLGSGEQADPLKDATQRLAGALKQAVAPVSDALQSTATQTKSALQKTKSAVTQSAERAKTRATATDPPRQPPLHGTNPHGQGGVAVVDLNPSNERPLSGDPTGQQSGEDVVVGRARGEQNADGTYHGHITIIGLFGTELGGVDTKEGETKNGPLQPLQEGVLDPLCTSTNGQVCLSVLTANSTTNANGSSNDFAIARAAVLGLGVGAAESGGVIGEDANCQTSAGTAKTANVVTAGGAVAQAANSATTSKSCRGQAPTTTSTSQVIALGGNGIALPATGCADGTPDTTVVIPLLATIVCNAEEIAGAARVREALDVFAVNVAGNSLVKETTAATEAISVAPAGAETGGPQCSDMVDNDNDGVIDAADPGCHSDGNANNPDSYNPNDNSEADSGTSGSGGETSAPECSDNRDNDGDGRIDENDPGCHTDGNANNANSYNADDDDERDAAGNAGSSGGGGAAQCADGVDNDGDGVIDADDPGCHTDGDASNPNSYNANDDSEGGNGSGVNASSLPMTGSNIVGLALAGLLLLAGGLVLRRREDARVSA